MSGNWENTAQLLNELNVTYVYLGGLERSAYGPQLNEKFDRHLEVAFRNDSVTIYQWHPE
jgi:uncharacterized membrane protein